MGTKKNLTCTDAEAKVEVGMEKLGTAARKKRHRKLAGRNSYSVGASQKIGGVFLGWCLVKKVEAYSAVTAAQRRRRTRRA